MPGWEYIGEEERHYCDQVFSESGILCKYGFDSVAGGRQFWSKRFEDEFSKFQGIPNSLFVTSGTAALTVALACLKLRKPHAKYVVTSSFTFVATIESIVCNGLVPICCDINETLTIDQTSLGLVIDELRDEILAVLPVHMLGYPCDMDNVKRLCAAHSISIVEDCAWGLGGSYRGNRLGTIGEVGCYSFDSAKMLTTGEGGMITENRGDQAFFNQLAAWHDHGHENNPSVPRWEDTRASFGFNFRPTELQAAVGIAQLGKAELILRGQKMIADFLVAHLPDRAILQINQGAIPTYDAFILQMPSNADARSVRDELLSIGVGSKILPEALKWHFAAHFDHINLNDRDGYCRDLIKNHWSQSAKSLEKCVAIPPSKVLTEEKLSKIVEIVKVKLG